MADNFFFVPPADRSGSEGGSRGGKSTGTARLRSRRMPFAPSDGGAAPF